MIVLNMLRNAQSCELAKTTFNVIHTFNAIRETIIDVLFVRVRKLSTNVPHMILASIAEILEEGSIVSIESFFWMISARLST